MTIAPTAPSHHVDRGAASTSAASIAAFRHLVSMPEGPERARVRRRLVATWLPMAHRLALRFRNRGENLEDLQQVAALGLVKAVDRYDPYRSEAFETYAVPTITGELQRHFRDNTWDLHVPRGVQEARIKVRKAVRELSTGLDDQPPSVTRVAALAGLSEEEAALGLSALQSYRTLSLDRALGDEDGFSLADTLGGTDPGFALVERREAARPGLAALPERERRILHMRFFENMTQSAIGKELGISQMHVSRLLSQACARVRDQAARPVGRRHAPAA